VEFFLCLIIEILQLGHVCTRTPCIKSADLHPCQGNLLQRNNFSGVSKTSLHYTKLGGGQLKKKSPFFKHASSIAPTIYMCGIRLWFFLGVGEGESISSVGLNKMKWVSGLVHRPSADPVPAADGAFHVRHQRQRHVRSLAPGEDVSLWQRALQLGY
jgi:hypothetical protein